MPELASVGKFPLVHGQAAQNWLNRALVGAITSIALVPFVLALGYIIPAGLVGTYSSASRLLSGEQIEKRHQPQPQNVRRDPLEWLETGPIGSLAATVAGRTAERAIILKLMPSTVVLLSAILALVLWGMSTSTTANLLAQMGARPANPDGREGEAARTLERFSIANGLPAPKLYIIQCSFPTTFSAAKDIQNAMVAVTTGAIDLLERRELDTLLAHELAHIINRDSRLAEILAPLAVVTEFPFRLFRGPTSPDPYNRGSWNRKLALLELALTPLGLYAFFISPVLNRLISALILRGREFKADANAAAITGNPEGLACALAKIGGVVTVVGKTTVSSLPAHTTLCQRIERLMGLYETFGFHGLEAAIAKGKLYAADRPGIGDDKPGLACASSLSSTPVMGRVYCVVSAEPVPVFDKASPGAMLLAHVRPGALLVAFDAPGKMRQVNTSEEVFGYIGRDVKLKAVQGVLPQEVYDPRSRAAAEEALGRLVGQTPSNLTRRHVWIALGFGMAVFACTTAILFAFAGH